MRKTLILGILSVSLVIWNQIASAAETSELSVKRIETKYSITGQKRSVIEEYTRDGVKVMSVIHLYREGKLVSSSRFTYAFGRKVMQEGDEDADGFYELRIITPSDDPNSVEVFRVEKDGAIKPASAAKLKEFRNQAEKQEAVGKLMREEIEKAKSGK